MAEKTLRKSRQDGEKISDILDLLIKQSDLWKLMFSLHFRYVIIFWEKKCDDSQNSFAITGSL